MTIVRSTVSLGHAQADGRIYVRESHEWDDGSTTVVEYGPVAPEKVDVDEIALTRAARLVSAQEAEMARVQEDEALRARVDSVLALAISAGTLTKEEAARAAGYVEAEKRGGGVTRG